MGNKVKTKKKKPIIQWVLTVFFGLCVFTFFPSVASILFALVTFALCPAKWIRAIWDRIWPKNWLRTLCITIAAFVAIMISPTEDVTTESVDSNVAITESSTVKNVIVENSTGTTMSVEDSVRESLPEDINVEISSAEDIGVTDNYVSETLTIAQEPTFAGESYFEVHYIDVGQGDCALVLCDDAAMLIDGGTSGNSSLLYSYLKAHDVDVLDYVIASHPHDDHVGGLAGALNWASAKKVMCSVASYDSEAFDDFVKYVTKQELVVEVPTAGESFGLGSAVVEILGVNAASDENNNSIVLKVTYGNTSFLFTGDATEDAEKVLLNSGCDLESTVLKVGHHGSSKGTTEAFLNEVMPKYAVISVGADNIYEHPENEVLSRLKEAQVTTYRTDMQGDIVCTSDGTNIAISVEKNLDVDTLQLRDESVRESSDNGSGGNSGSSNGNGSGNIDSGNSDVGKSDSGIVAPAGTTYVLNTNTKKFHYQSCRSVKQMKDKNKAFHTGTRDEVISMGYDPCGNCHP